jgi:hypothetical protein
MPRVNRHFLPGLAWYLIHHCHQRKVLLDFSQDRSTWLREQVKRDLDLNARHRRVDITNGHHILREPGQPYTAHFNTENTALCANSAVLWPTYLDTSEA